MPIKISALPGGTTLGNSDIIPAVQSGTTVGLTGDNILDAAEARTANTFGEGFHQPSSFTNNFAQDGTTPVKVWSTGFNNQAIYMNGLLDCSLVTFTPGSYIQAFRLPAGFYRPTKTLNFPVFGPNDAIGVCQIQSDGFVYFKNVYGDLTTGGIIDLANVSYYPDPF